MMAGSFPPARGAACSWTGAGDSAGRYWRWWLLSHAPETGDSEFTWEGFQTAVNKDLADVLGNFVSRVTKFCRSRFGEAVPGGGHLWGPQEDALIAELQARLAAYAAHMDAIEVRKSAAELRAIWVAGNEYLQAAAPWAAFKEDPDRAAAIIRLALNLIRLYAVLSAVLPHRRLFIPHGFSVPGNLFDKITDAQRIEWHDRFAGGRG
jgi:methionyl-tRNA synthetase